MPNPTHSMVEVAIPSASGAILKVFNASGQNIVVVETAQGDYTIKLNLTGLPQGLYWASFQSADGRNDGAAKIFLTH